MFFRHYAAYCCFAICFIPLMSAIIGYACHTLCWLCLLSRRFLRYFIICFFQAACQIRCPLDWLFESTRHAFAFFLRRRPSADAHTCRRRLIFAFIFIITLMPFSLPQFRYAAITIFSDAD